MRYKELSQESNDKVAWPSGPTLSICTWKEMNTLLYYQSKKKTELAGNQYLFRLSVPGVTMVFEWLTLKRPFSCLSRWRGGGLENERALVMIWQVVPQSDDLIHLTLRDKPLMAQVNQTVGQLYDTVITSLAIWSHTLHLYMKRNEYTSLLSISNKFTKIKGICSWPFIYSYSCEISEIIFSQSLLQNKPQLKYQHHHTP